MVWSAGEIGTINFRFILGGWLRDFKEILTCSLRNGLTMAQYLSPESAVNVNTETPTDTSLANSVRRHKVLPIGEDSVVYTIMASGTQISITSRSARASEKM